MSDMKGSPQRALKVSTGLEAIAETGCRIGPLITYQHHCTRDADTEKKVHPLAIGEQRQEEETE